MLPADFVWKAGIIGQSQLGMDRAGNEQPMKRLAYNVNQSCLELNDIKYNHEFAAVLFGPFSFGSYDKSS